MVKAQEQIALRQMQVTQERKQDSNRAIASEVLSCEYLGAI